MCRNSHGKVSRVTNSFFGIEDFSYLKPGIQDFRYFKFGIRD